MPIHYEKFYSEKNLVKKYTDLFVPSIHKVIFNGPATIVIWADGVKTVVMGGLYRETKRVSRVSG